MTLFNALEVRVSSKPESPPFLFFFFCFLFSVFHSLFSVCHLYFQFSGLLSLIAVIFFVFSFLFWSLFSVLFIGDESGDRSAREVNLSEAFLTCHGGYHGDAKCLIRTCFCNKSFR